LREPYRTVVVADIEDHNGCMSTFDCYHWDIDRLSGLVPKWKCCSFLEPPRQEV